MKLNIWLGAVLLAVAAAHLRGTRAQAQIYAPTVVKRNGYSLQARAYVDASRLPSRYDLRLLQPKNTPYRWDFVIPGSNYPRTQALASVGTGDYRTQKQATIRATLRQYDTYEEKVSFKNLPLAPIDRAYAPSRVLSLSQARSITTPSGITITLPAQNYDVMPPGIAGDPNVIFIRVDVTPGDKLIASLPRSPLWIKHHRPVSLQVGKKVVLPWGEEFYYQDVPLNYGLVTISLPKLETATQLAELTLKVRQRTDLQTVPLAIKVPISKPTRQKSK